MSSVEEESEQNNTVGQTPAHWSDFIGTFWSLYSHLFLQLYISHLINIVIDIFLIYFNNVHIDKCKKKEELKREIFLFIFPLFLLFIYLFIVCLLKKESHNVSIIMIVSCTFDNKNKLSK